MVNDLLYYCCTFFWNFVQSFIVLLLSYTVLIINVTEYEKDDTIFYSITIVNMGVVDNSSTYSSQNTTPRIIVYYTFMNNLVKAFYRLIDFWIKCCLKVLYQIYMLICWLRSYVYLNFLFRWDTFVEKSALLTIFHNFFIIYLSIDINIQIITQKYLKIILKMYYTMYCNYLFVFYFVRNEWPILSIVLKAVPPCDTKKYILKMYYTMHYNCLFVVYFVRKEW